MRNDTRSFKTSLQINYLTEIRTLIILYLLLTAFLN